LVGIAYQEAIAAAGKALDTGVGVQETAMMSIIFFFVSIRFFIGNQLHLLSDSLIELPGTVWLYDVMVIIVQSVTLVFLGTNVYYDPSNTAIVGFVEFLIVLYVIDVFWIVSQWALGFLSAQWRRPFVPWAWAILNSILVVGMMLVYWASDSPLSREYLAWLLALNLVAFIVDLILLDYYEAL
jgi:hypothetical protein